jgi:hypothetical protein
MMSKPLAGDLRLPDFLIIGAMKAGTTALHSYLARHPQLYMSQPKELKFFVEEFNWSQGPDWYAHFFEAAGDSRRAGESSPHYSMATQYRGVPERIAGLLPDAKLIYLIRDPVARIRSAYLHRVSRGREHRSFHDAVRRDEPYVNDSRYGWQLEQYLAHFERSQILIVEAERLRTNRAAAMTEILRFLEVEEDPTLCGHLSDVHVTAKKSEPHPMVRGASRLLQPVKSYIPVGLKKRLARMRSVPLDISRAELTIEVEQDLRERLADDVRRLRTHVGGDFQGWGIS